MGFIKEQYFINYFLIEYKFCPFTFNPTSLYKVNKKGTIKDYGKFNFTNPPDSQTFRY